MSLFRKCGLTISIFKVIPINFPNQINREIKTNAFVSLREYCLRIESMWKRLHKNIL